MSEPSMRRMRSVFGWVFGLFFVVIILAECLVFAIQFRNRSKAEMLLKEIQKIHVGESTAADVNRITQGYIDAGVLSSSSMCASADSSSSIRISSDALNDLGTKFPKLRLVGLRPWGVVATFLLDRGKVCYFEYSLGTVPRSDRNEMHLTVVSVPSMSSDNQAKYEFYSARYSVARGYIHNFTTQLYPEATADQRRRAFDFDLSCLTKLQGCKNPCEVMPSAWIDYQKDAKEKDGEGPADELADFRCKNR
jgi:hypothetical protein